MRKFRFTPLIVSILGLLLCGGVGAAIYFLLISPKAADLAAQQERYSASASYLDPSQKTQAQAALVKAQAQAATVRAQWSYVQRVDNPTIDLSDRYLSWYQWTNEVNNDFAPRLNKFLTHTGVTPLTEISAPSTVNDPNAVPSGTLAVALGTINVFGSYSQILNHVADWNRFDRIVLVDGLSLSGYSPFMTGSYTATEYIFTQNSEKPGPPVPSPPTQTGAKPPTDTNLPLAVTPTLRHT